MKVSYATGVDPQVRFKELAAFMKKHGFEDKADFYSKSAKLISTKEDPGNVRMREQEGKPKKL